VPEFIDRVFGKTSPIRSFCMTENERFGLVFPKTGSINSGTGIDFQLGGLVLQPSAGIFKKSLGASNRLGIGLWYRPSRLHRLAEFNPWNRFLVSLKVYKFGLWLHRLAESIPGILKTFTNSGSAVRLINTGFSSSC
jgi:hypothetical protein